MASAYKSPDGMAIRKLGFFHGWTPWTWVNILYHRISFGNIIHTCLLNLSLEAHDMSGCLLQIVKVTTC